VFLQTPLHLAFIYDVNPEIILLLIKYGGIVDILDNEGKKPYNYANSTEAIKYALVIKEDLKKLSMLNKEDSTVEYEMDTKNNSLDNNTNHTMSDHGLLTNRNNTENKIDISIYNTEHNKESKECKESKERHGLFSINTDREDREEVEEEKYDSEIEEEKDDNDNTDEDINPVTDRERFSEMNPLDTQKYFFILITNSSLFFRKHENSSSHKKKYSEFIPDADIIDEELSVSVSKSKNSLKNSKFILKKSSDDIDEHILDENEDNSENLNDSLEYSTNKQYNQNIINHNKQISIKSNVTSNKNFNFITSPGKNYNIENVANILSNNKENYADNNQNEQVYTSYNVSNTSSAQNKKEKRMILTTPKQKKMGLLYTIDPNLKCLVLSTSKKDQRKNNLFGDSFKNIQFRNTPSNKDNKENVNSNNLNSFINYSHINDDDVIY